jgi:hypothetical protein
VVYANLLSCCAAIATKCKVFAEFSEPCSTTSTGDWPMVNDSARATSVIGRGAVAGAVGGPATLYLSGNRVGLPAFVVAMLCSAESRGSVR